jgi:hypothetical protein
MAIRSRSCSSRRASGADPAGTARRGTRVRVVRRGGRAGAPGAPLRRPTRAGVSFGDTRLCVVQDARSRVLWPGRPPVCRVGHARCVVWPGRRCVLRRSAPVSSCPVARGAMRGTSTRASANTRPRVVAHRHLVSAGRLCVVWDTCRCVVARWPARLCRAGRPPACRTRRWRNENRPFAQRKACDEMLYSGRRRTDPAGLRDRRTEKIEQDSG